MKNNTINRFFIGLLICFSCLQAYAALPYGTYDTAYDINHFEWDDMDLLEFYYTSENPGGRVYVKIVVKKPSLVTATHQASLSPNPAIKKACLSLEDANKKQLLSVCSNGRDTAPYANFSQELEPGTYYIISEPDDNLNPGMITLKLSCSRIPPNLDGRDFRQDAGTISRGKCVEHTFDTSMYMNTCPDTKIYGDAYTDFKVNGKMDVIINLRGSNGEAVCYSYILNSEGTILYSFSHGNDDLCDSKSRKRVTLESGSYTLVSEINDRDALMEQSIYGATTYYGDTMEEAIYLGAFSNSFSVTDSRYLHLYDVNYGHSYSGGDIYYYLQLNKEMDLTISLKNSLIRARYIFLADKNGQLITSAVHELEVMLEPGEYYIICNGTSVSTTQKDLFLEVNGVYTPPQYQSVNGLNYIESTTPLYASGSSGTIEPIRKKEIKTISYFDGLGKSIQTIEVGFTPSGKDMVSQIEYNARGKAFRNWLPVPSAYSDGTHLDELTQLKKDIKSFYGDTKPYRETMYESTVKQRPLQQTSVGTHWQNNPVNMAYAVTNIFELVKKYEVNSNGDLVSNGWQSSLKKTQVTDEDGNITRKYTDPTGKLILERKINDGVAHDTYHVYDQMGRKRYVLPPMVAYTYNVNGTYPLTNDNELGLYAYYYRYDKRGLCVEKKLPGAEPEYIVYDRSHRPVMTQTGNQRLKQLWTLIRYDHFGRVTYTSELFNWNNHEELLRAFTPFLIVERFDPTVESVMSEIGYTCGVFHELDARLMTVNYYDDYRFIEVLSKEEQDILTFKKQSNYDNQYTSAKGLLTGTRVYDSQNPDIYTTTAYYYDHRGNQVQVLSTNHMGGYEKHYYKRNFSGTVSRYGHTHTTDGEKIYTETYKYTYDHVERLTKTTHSIDFVKRSTIDPGKELPGIDVPWTGGGLVSATNTSVPVYDEVVLSQIQYDELGRPITKSLHGGKETVSYAYNIHGWLTDQASKHFSLKLDYSPYYNGNIGQMSWKSGTQDFWSKYAFSYDNLNRMLSATYGEYGMSLNYPDRNTYSVEARYDKNGNITGLVRYGGYKSIMSTVPSKGEPPTVPPLLAGVIDDLKFEYKGNQMVRITDNAPHDPVYKNAMHFVDGANYTKEYSYDANGNMTLDWNKGITSMSYNNQNLPTAIYLKVGDGHKIENYYNSAGKKFRVRYKSQDLGIKVIDPGIDGPGIIKPIDIDSIPSLIANEGNPLVAASSSIATDPPYISRPIDNLYKTQYTIDYCDNFIYRDGELERILLPGGYLIPENNSKFTYYYYLQDHLGNNRVVIDQNGNLEEVNEYYPFGGLYSKETSQPFKFGDKELERMHGLDLYDFLARPYDPMLGRFTTMDPMAEKYYSISPYAYCANNPIKFIDPDGRQLVASKSEGIHDEAVWTPDDPQQIEELTKADAEGNIGDDNSSDGDQQSEWDRIKELLGQPLSDEEIDRENVERWLASLPQSGKIDIVPVEFYLIASIKGNIFATGKAFMNFIKSLNKKKEDNTYTVTPDGVVLPKDKKIPENYVENPDRTGSYGIYENGRFQDKLRIDPGTPPGQKGPNESHFHLNNGRKHIFDLSRWPKNTK